VQFEILFRGNIRMREQCLPDRSTKAECTP